MSNTKFEQLSAYVEALEWTFASTMPNNPHWWSLKKHWNNDPLFTYFISFIRKHGYHEVFHGKTYRMLDIGEYKYFDYIPIEDDRQDPEIIYLVNRKYRGT